MPAPRQCAECGAELPSDAPNGLCVVCALRRAENLPASSEPPASTITLSLPLAEKPGDRIGRYKLLEKIGEGGMGTVHVALQEEPLRRKVALKIIKLGMDTREVVARFEAERQALALMSHPNIAKVLDAGATGTGRPFFVMEWVQGERITDYCDRHNLPTRARLDLFMQVCGAIQHAHQKGIIHRDIKPSNILVSLQEDGKPVPKIIDFGIAKATAGQRLTNKTLHTAIEQFIGTPAYMSPEQAEMTSVDIDTRSDIYSLGVLLYELLTGKTPFDSTRLVQAGLAEIRRIIREEDPPKPSTRLSTLKADEQTTVAKRRQTHPAELIHQVRGDLDWIVMKTLEKDRTRRYETPSGLALDLKRLLNNEPVLASPPSNLYRFRKLIRRNKLKLAATACGAVTLVALVISATILCQELQARKYGGIALTTFPEGTEVWLNGERIGTTPYENTHLAPGEMTYVLKLANYQSIEKTITVKPGRVWQFVEPMKQLNSSSTNLMLTAIAPKSTKVLEVHGTVEVASHGSTNWVLATTNMALFTGDRLRTGPKSRATLGMLDSSVTTFGELTELEIAAKDGQGETVNLLRGILHFFDREKPGRIRVINKGAVAGVQG